MSEAHLLFLLCESLFPTQIYFFVSPPPDVFTKGSSLPAGRMTDLHTSFMKHNSAGVSTATRITSCTALPGRKTAAACLKREHILYFDFAKPKRSNFCFKSHQLVPFGLRGNISGFLPGLLPAGNYPGFSNFDVSCTTAIIVLNFDHANAIISSINLHSLPCY